MPICNQCGEQIEFRYVNGRCVPIHPGGGWHCGSYSAASSFLPTRVSRAGDWPVRDFTRPTHCPECGDNVFFIRHNGGSVWVDELGWPWPKHRCFDKPNESTRTFALWTARSSGLTHPKLAIIARLIEDYRHAEPILEIHYTDSTRATLVLRYTPATSSLLGALVVVSTEDGLLLHQEHAEIPFHTYTPLVPTDPEGFYTCQRCKAWVKVDTGHEEYCRQHYRAKAPLPPSTPNRKAAEVFRQRAKAIARKLERPPVIRQLKPLPKLVSPPITTSPPAPQPNPRIALTLEGRIAKAVESVAQEAWAAVAEVQGPDEQVSQAKQEALRLIAMLSPSIKRQVGATFTADKWKPLLAARPSS